MPTDAKHRSDHMLTLAIRLLILGGLLELAKNMVLAFGVH